MPKNAPVQSYGALNLASFPGWPITKVLKSANMKNFGNVGKSIRDPKRKENHA